MLARPPLGIPTRERGNEGNAAGSRISTGAFAARARLLHGGRGVGCLWESRPRDEGCLNRGRAGVGVLFCLQLLALMGRGLAGDLAYQILGSKRSSLRISTMSPVCASTNKPLR